MVRPRTLFVELIGMGTGFGYLPGCGRLNVEICHLRFVWVGNNSPL